MSIKSSLDKKREGYPCTARQRRRAKGNRLSRKQARHRKGVIRVKAR